MQQSGSPWRDWNTMPWRPWFHPSRHALPPIPSAGGVNSRTTSPAKRGARSCPIASDANDPAPIAHRNLPADIKLKVKWDAERLCLSIFSPRAITKAHWPLTSHSSFQTTRPPFVKRVKPWQKWRSTAFPVMALIHWKSGYTKPETFLRSFGLNTVRMFTARVASTPHSEARDRYALFIDCPRSLTHFAFGNPRANLLITNPPARSDFAPFSPDQSPATTQPLVSYCLALMPHTFGGERYSFVAVFLSHTPARGTGWDKELPPSVRAEAAIFMTFMPCMWSRWGTVRPCVYIASNRPGWNF